MESCVLCLLNLTIKYKDLYFVCLCFLFYSFGISFLLYFTNVLAMIVMNVFLKTDLLTQLVEDALI